MDHEMEFDDWINNYESLNAGNLYKLTGNYLMEDVGKKYNSGLTTSVRIRSGVLVTRFLPLDETLFF